MSDKAQRTRRRTFKQILETTRLEAARRLWRRAKLASWVRHAVRARRGNGTRHLGDIKRNAIIRAVALAPDRIHVTIDSDRYIGLLSIRWPGCGRLHLPADVQLPVVRPERISDRPRGPVRRESVLAAH